MNKSDFYFDLPKELIAQHPLESRDASRLLCLRKVAHRAVSTLGHKNDAQNCPLITHHCFKDLPDLLTRGDCLVLNDSRVLPARLLGTDAAGFPIEVLLLKVCHGDGSPDTLCHSERSEESSAMCVTRTVPMTHWECLVRPGKKVKKGASLTFGNGELTAAVIEVMDNGNRLIEFRCSGNFLEILESLGKMPFPPYIIEELQDPERYQTVYSKELGSAAAPTAGLHFTPELLKTLQDQGIKTCCITLHVGLGTFRPVKTDKIEEHVMHSEHFTIPKETADAINQTKQAGGRIIAVGTTTCRTLESVAEDDGTVAPKSGETDIFIYPGYEFKCIDGLITNFHLPESTLIMLVSALAGREQTLKAYEEAIAQKYRFYSLGDAMLVL